MWIVFWNGWMRQWNECALQILWKMSTLGQKYSTVTNSAIQYVNFFSITWTHILLHPSHISIVKRIIEKFVSFWTWFLLIVKIPYHLSSRIIIAIAKRNDGLCVHCFWFSSVNLTWFWVCVCARTITIYDLCIIFHIITIIQQFIGLECTPKRARETYKQYSIKCDESQLLIKISILPFTRLFK